MVTYVCGEHNFIDQMQSTWITFVRPWKISNVIGNEMRQANVMTKLRFVYTFLALTRIFNTGTSELRAHSVYTRRWWRRRLFFNSKENVAHSLFALWTSSTILPICTDHLKNSTYPHEDDKWRVLRDSIVPSLTSMIFAGVSNQMQSNGCFFFFIHSTMFWTGLWTVVLSNIIDWALVIFIYRM